MAEDAIQAMTAFDKDCEEQLRALLSSLPAEAQDRFLPSALRAASVLEKLSPAILAPRADGLVSGVFSMVSPEYVAVIGASPEKVLFDVVSVSSLEDYVEDALARFADAGVSAEERVEHYGGVVVKALEQFGADADSPDEPTPADLPVFAELVMWRAQGSFALLREASRSCIAAAALALAAKDGDGVITTAICYARHCPPQLMAN